MMIEKETGFLRRQWNYFKRGKSEINFLLNIYQTLIIIMGVGSISKDYFLLFSVTLIFGIVLLVASLAIGKYSLTKVDPSLPFINPYTQDIIVHRHLMASGIVDVIEGRKEDGIIKLKNSYTILDRWIKDG